MTDKLANDFANTLEELFELMIKRSHVMESGKMHLAPDKIFSYKIRRLKK